MSRFSGKCDVYDWFCDKDDDYIRQSKVYFSGGITPLEINSQHDLAPYYPHIIVYGGGDRSGHSIIALSKRSYVDEREEERNSWALSDCLRYYRRCKRKKVPYI